MKQKSVFSIIPDVSVKQNKLKRMFPIKEGIKLIAIDYTFQRSADHEKGLLSDAWAFRRRQNLTSEARKLIKDCVM